MARLDERQGQRVLFEALDRLAKDDVTPRVELVGGGPLEAELRQRAATLGLSDQVVFCGWRDAAAVREHLDRGRCVVLPSRAEGLPVSRMEAMARARPVVATRVAGVGELVEDDLHGARVAPGDAAELAAALGRVLRQRVGPL